MPHPLVEQLRFARSEFVRSLVGVAEEEATRRFGAINSLSWMVGHLADQEQRYWLVWRGKPLVEPTIGERCGHGRPGSTPPLAEMWGAWRAITAAVDPYLDGLKVTDLAVPAPAVTWPHPESVGTMLLRMTGHYWFHNGEAQAVRQMLGHRDLPEFVGAIGREAPYRPEAVAATAAE